MLPLGRGPKSCLRVWSGPGGEGRGCVAWTAGQEVSWVPSPWQSGDNKTLRKTLRYLQYRTQGPTGSTLHWESPYRIFLRTKRATVLLGSWPVCFSSQVPGPLAGPVHRRIWRRDGALWWHRVSGRGVLCEGLTKRPLRASGSCILCSCELSAILIRQHIDPPAFGTRLGGLGVGTRTEDFAALILPERRGPCSEGKTGPLHGRSCRGSFLSSA